MAKKLKRFRVGERLKAIGGVEKVFEQFSLQFGKYLSLIAVYHSNLDIETARFMLENGIA